MKKFLKTIGLMSFVTAAVFILCFYSLAADTPEKPRIAPLCKQCHAPDEKILRGTFTSISKSKEFGSIQMQIGPATWIIKWDERTKLVGEERYTKIPKDKEIAVTVSGKGDDIYAEVVSVKPPAQVPGDKLIMTDAVAKLVDQGSEKGRFMIVDSRPGPRYQEGHIPGAVLIYDADFDKQIEKLPKDKDILLIFYCGGTT